MVFFLFSGSAYVSFWIGPLGCLAKAPIHDIRLGHKLSRFTPQRLATQLSLLFRDGGVGCNPNSCWAPGLQLVKLALYSTSAACKQHQNEASAWHGGEAVEASFMGLLPRCKCCSDCCHVLDRVALPDRLTDWLLWLWCFDWLLIVWLLTVLFS